MKNIYYYYALSQKSPAGFAKRLCFLLERSDIGSRPLILLCIGSDRSTGDSLGPLIGHKLENTLTQRVLVYGTLKRPVHAMNLCEVLRRIAMFHPDAFVIAIDASLGSNCHVGYVTLSDTSLRPGLGVQKNLPAVGDLCITGIVNLSGDTDGLQLQSTRLSTVMELADFISSGIQLALHTYESSSITCNSR